MNDTYNYVIQKFNLDLTVKLPYTRGTLINIFKELGFNKGAEIGVANGRFSESLCLAIPDLKMYCVDPWEMYEGYKERNLSREKMNTEYESAKEKLAPFNCEIIKDTSMNAIKKFSPNSLDFVYIDANHAYKYVLEDVTEWTKIVRMGGIVSGHDYKALGGTLPEVGIAIDKYVKDHKIRTLFTFMARNDASWFFVK